MWHPRSINCHQDSHTSNSPAPSSFLVAWTSEFCFLFLPWLINKVLILKLPLRNKTLSYLACFYTSRYQTALENSPSCTRHGGAHLWFQHSETKTEGLAVQVHPQLGSKFKANWQDWTKLQLHHGFIPHPPIKHNVPPRSQAFPVLLHARVRPSPAYHFPALNCTHSR